jgi:hypothetical protein
MAETFRRGVESDRGGADGMTTVETGYVRHLTEAETLLSLLAQDLSARGLFTARGRVRCTFDRWVTALNAWDRLACRVGGERRAKAVSLSDYLARASGGSK